MASIRRGKSMDTDRNLGLSHPGAFFGTDPTTIDQTSMNM
jgi:hypothetical protein